MVVALVLASGVAFGYWSAGSTPGGSGAAAATTVAQGATPTATATNGGGTVVVGWAARTLATGTAVTGYQVNRYATGGSTAQTMLSACTGTVTALTCTESNVPTGSWQYTVTPVLATNWRGAESAKSTAVTTDGTPPTSSITLSDRSGGAYRSGATVYYRGSDAGSFTLTNAVADAGTGPASSATGALGGTTTGWSHTPSTVSAPAGGPYVSNPFTWTAGTASSPTQTVTARDVGGTTTSTSLAFVNDSTGPGAGTLSYIDGSTGGTTNAVSFTTGTDSGSGVGTRLLQRASAPLTGISCGTYTDFATTVGGTNPVSPFLDAVGADTCYKYRYVVADNVGNTTTTTSTAVSHSPYGAHYRFDAGSGTTAVDSTGNGNTATLMPGAGWTAGRTGSNALDLDGSSGSWASAPNPVIDSSQSFTVAGWVKFDAITGFQTLVAMDGTNVSPFYLQRRGDTGTFSFTQFSADNNGGLGKIVTGTTPVTGTWYHLTGVFDQPAGTIQLYVDGVSQGTATGASSFRAQGATTIGRGKFNGGPADLFDGAIDDARFYDRVLTPAQVATLADGTAPTGGSVDATGLTGTGNRYSTSTTLSLTLAKGTDPSGLAATGSQLLRSAGTLSSGSCTGFGGYTQVGADDPVSPKSDTVPDGACYRYRYVVPDDQGNAATYTSGDIKVDTTAPTAPTLGFSALTNASATGSTVYYRPGATSGGFTVTASASDPSSGIGSYAFPGLGTGWTSTAGVLGTNTYAWAAASPSTPGAASVTATSLSGATSAGTPLTVTPDSAAPSAGTVTYADGSTTGTSVSVAFTAGTDAGSGLGTRLLQRAGAPVTGTTCGTYGAFATVTGGTDPTSPVVDSIDVDTCYKYQYVVADKVGNTTTATSTAVAHTPFGAAYAFDAGSGTTALDSTGNGNTATLQPGAGWTTGKIGPGALDLNGSSGSWASAPNPVIDSSQSFTVSGWVKFDAIGGFQTIASIDGDNVSPFYLQRRGDTGTFSLTQFSADNNGGLGKIVTGTSPVTGVWYHLTGVYDQPAGAIQLYVNGVSQGTVTGASSFRAQGSTNIGRGKFAGGPADLFDGAIDDVRFYDRVLTPAEVTALANPDMTGPTGGSVTPTGLVGTGSRYSTSTTVNLSLAKGTDPSGTALSGNQLTRATATLSNGACGTYGSYTLVTGGTDPGASVSDTAPNGACYAYRYVVSDTVGNSTTYASGDVKVDTTPPGTPTLGFSAFTNASATGSTVYYRPGAANGGFTVTANASDPMAGIASYAFPGLGTGWTSTAGAIGVNAYSWSAANPATPASPAVTATNNAGTASAATALTVTPDGTAPSAGTVTYADTTQSSTSISVAYTTGTDGGSGLGTRLLQRASATLTGTTCGTYGGFTTVTGGTNPAGSPVSDTVTTGSCYKYQYVVSDQVGNAHTATSTAVVKVTGAAACGTQLLANPGFENGATSTPWTQSPTDIVSTGSPRTGTWKALLGGNGTDTTETLSQDVTIPAGCSASLAYYLAIGTAETSGPYDFFRVQVISGGTTTTVQTFSDRNTAAGYVQQTVSLSAYAGQSITLRFLSDEDATNQTGFYLDDTSLTTSPIP